MEVAPPTRGFDCPFQELSDLIEMFKIGFSAPQLVLDDIKRFRTLCPTAEVFS